MLLLRQRELQRELVALGSESAYDACREVGHAGVVPERFTRKDIAQMNLDERDANPGKRIAQRNAGMGIGSRVDDDERHTLVAGRLYAVNQRPLMVVLKTTDLHAGRLALGNEPAVHRGKRGAAVNCRLANAQQVEIRPVNNQNVAPG